MRRDSVGGGVLGENRYGHPDQSVVESLGAVGAEIHRTDRDGSLIVTSDGSSLTFEAVKGRIAK